MGRERRCGMAGTKPKRRRSKYEDRLEYYRKAKHLIVEVGWQYDGGVYEVHHWSEDRIRAAYPEAVINPGILLGYDETEDYERFHRPYWPQLVQMLTGLTPEQIAALGGVEIRDDEKEKTLWTWHPTLTESA
jgi:hypothetical protein